MGGVLFWKLYSDLMMILGAPLNGASIQGLAMAWEDPFVLPPSKIEGDTTLHVGLALDGEIVGCIKI
jgi:hypothetical protein